MKEKNKNIVPRRPSGTVLPVRPTNCVKSHQLCPWHSSWTPHVCMWRCVRDGDDGCINGVRDWIYLRHSSVYVPDHDHSAALRRPLHRLPSDRSCPLRLLPVGQSEPFPPCQRYDAALSTLLKSACQERRHFWHRETWHSSGWCAHRTPQG